MLKAFFWREITLALRQGGYFGTAIGFFLTMLVLIPLSVGPDVLLLQKVAPGFLWIALLLSVLLSCDHLFGADYEDGSLDLLVASGFSLPLFVSLKIMFYWALSGLPLALVCPVLGVLLNIDPQRLLPLMMGMAVGSLGLCCVAGLCAALTVGLRRAGVLMSVLALPLYVPIVVFGLSASVPSSMGGGALSSFSLLLALVLFLCLLVPWAGAALLRGHLS